jgi:enoyl reductase-like protein/3-oxoacyl-ACP reductase-like protein/acyl dehydratase
MESHEPPGAGSAPQAAGGAVGRDGADGHHRGNGAPAQAHNGRSTAAADNDIVTAAAFLQTALQTQTGPEFSAGARTALLARAFDQFHQAHVEGNDIHVATRDLSNQGEVLSAYNRAKAELGREYHSPSALLAAAQAGDAGLFAEFGGQANDYYGELSRIYQAYPEIRGFLRELGQVLAEQANSSEARALGFHSEGLDVVRWLENPSETPAPAYLASVPVSMPLIGLTQLAHYYNTLCITGKTPGEMLALLKGATGHSQGIVSAVAIASSRTPEELIANCRKAAAALFWLGTRMQHSYPQTTLDPAIVSKSIAAGDGVPTPMLAVLKLTPETVGRYVEQVNRRFVDGQKLYISLVNGRHAVIVSGPPESNHRLLEALRADEAKKDEHGNYVQGRVPFSERKLEFSASYLPVTGPFHSPYMQLVPELAPADLERVGATFTAEGLVIPVYHTEDGSNLQTSPDLMMDLIVQQSVSRVNWPTATAAARTSVDWPTGTKAGVTHVIDFGPGGTAGVGAITARNLEGTGVQVVLAGSLRGTSALLDKGRLFDSDPASVQIGQSWAGEFGPKLVRLGDGTVMVDTKFTRLLGKPPVMAAGMTPTSANARFVAGVTNAGYHAELAGGGQHTEAYFRQRVDEVIAAVPGGESITVNLLFVTPHLWNFQYPLVEVLHREGKPIDGVTIAAGVPEKDEATEILTKLREIGVAHVSFKPGDVASIRRVVEIAEANPGSQIIMQVTGGRAGGHHSFEDAHQPLLQTYAAIRRCPNIVLVFGSGLGDAEGCLPYLTGEWSRALGYPSMPVDGVLLASRLMVAREASTSPDAKRLIVEAPGISDESAWEQSYKGEAGGVSTVVSEMGEPIHKVRNRAIALWQELDRKYFGLEPAKRAAAILADKAEIIERINRDYQKLYFGRKADGTVCDLPEMTYAEVLGRMLELMYVSEPYDGNPQRWIDVTFRNRVYDFMLRTEARFTRTGDTVALLQSPRDIENNPLEALGRLLERYPQARETLIASEDVDYFMGLCLRAGKPVNFVPVIDGDLPIWFKKDSLWQSEDLEAVPGHDAGRVAILQGPVAALHVATVDEPVADIMGRINKGIIDALRPNYPNESDIPTVEYLGGPSIARVALEQFPGVHETTLIDEARVQGRAYDLPLNLAVLPETAAWLELLAGSEYSWLRAFLTTPQIVRDRTRIESPVARLFRPRPGQRVEIRQDERGRPFAIRILDPQNNTGETPALEARLDGDRIHLTFNHCRPASSYGPAQITSLDLEYRYNPRQGYAPIHEVTEGRNQAIKNFYGRLWDLEGGPSVNDTFHSSWTASGKQIELFRQAIGNNQALYVHGRDGHGVAPYDMAAVAAWRPLIQTVFPPEIDGNIFDLLDLSKGFRLLDPTPLQEGDVVETEMRITEVRNNPVVGGRTLQGKRVTGRGTLTRNGQPWMELESQLLIRGDFADHEATFRNHDERREVSLATATDIAVLCSKPWFKLGEGVELHPGDRLDFHVDTVDRFHADNTLAQTTTQGVVLRDGVTIATIEYNAENVVDNAVHGSRPDPSDTEGKKQIVGYLGRYGKLVDAPVLLEEKDRYTLLAEPDTVTVPRSNERYAIAGGDFNPIHVNGYIADLAGLPGTITHGLWYSANGRRVVETYAANNHPERVLNYQPTFNGMVMPGDTLSTQVRHVGMRNGCRVVEVETVNQDGATVLTATAEVAPPPTAYVFTGQGSQSPGMGMDLYQSSAVARGVWDQADAHLQETFGFSILDVVRNNPRELTVRFGGPRGARIRQNLMALGSLPEITATSESYTFRHPEGLLNATQFTQPAIALYEIAAHADMQARGLIPDNSLFAGHSLGEYAALAAIGEAMPVEAVAELVFLRGMTMQRAVPRDADGRSPYRMAAVNPSRVGRWFNESALQGLVEAIGRSSGHPLEIVNFNVEGSQYIVTGAATNVQALYEALTGHLKGSPESLNDLAPVVTAALEEAAAKQAGLPLGSLVIPSESKAVIPLEGIDVPFHSTVLRGGVDAFRNVLSERIPQHLDVDRLVDRYIPNLTAKPFSLDRDYVESVSIHTESPVLRQVLENWDTVSQNRQVLGRTLLIECLAYQFASRVRWIETQDLIFGQGVERLIEVGPTSDLGVMAKRTLKAAKHAALPPREILSIDTDRDGIYFTSAQPLAVPAAPPNGAATQAPVPVPPTPAPAAAPPPPVAAPAAPPSPPPVTVAAPAAGPIPDAKPTALEALQVLVAGKVRKPLNEVGPDATIKNLVGGKSAVQTTIGRHLQAEFGPGPDNFAELPLSKLAEAMGGAYSGSGSQSKAQIDTLISTKMPGGFGRPQISAYLGTERCLGEGRIQGVLLHALTMEPPSRLSSETEAKAWLDQACDGYGQKVGQTIPKGGAQAAPAAAMVTAGPAVTVDNKALLAQQAKMELLIRDTMRAYSEFLGEDPRAGELRAEMEANLRRDAEAQLALLAGELGEDFIKGIKPIFDSRRERTYDSAWNWGRQEMLTLYHDLNTRRLSGLDPTVAARIYSLLNRASEDLVAIARHCAAQGQRDEKPEIHELFSDLAVNLEARVNQPPRYLEHRPSLAPELEITPQGEKKYREVPRAGIHNALDYVEEMRRGAEYAVEQIPAGAANLRLQGMTDQLETLISILENAGDDSTYYREIKGDLNARLSGKKRVPHLLLKEAAELDANVHVYDPQRTKTYLDTLETLARDGVSFAGQTYLVVGAGRDSIAIEVVKNLLSGGATVVTTSLFGTRAEADFYQGIYQEYGAKGSRLITIPMNQGSLQDTDALVEYIYAPTQYSHDGKNQGGLGLDLDGVLPFAALSENGRNISGIDSHSEYVHRLMLTNVIRLLGAVRNAKQERGIDTRPAHVILPMSPNHGLFGGDGLYAESKIGLEPLLNKWDSEGWSPYLSLAGAAMGWTRGTGVMAPANPVSPGMERLGARTFSQTDMAFNLTGLLHPNMVAEAQRAPVWADLVGGFGAIPDLKGVRDELNAGIDAEVAARKAVTADAALDAKVEGVQPTIARTVAPKANFGVNFPELPSAARRAELQHLQGMIDLDKTVVVTGFGEVGPWGSARTRWDMESQGEFSLEGAIELAWVTGRIKYHNGKIKDKDYTGWIAAKAVEIRDKKTEQVIHQVEVGDPVPDHMVKTLYEPTILEGAGIRIVEPEINEGHDPDKLMVLREVQITRDMRPIEVSNEPEAQDLKRQHGEKVDVYERDGQWYAQFKKGAILHIPKALRFDRFVAGQIPTGWDASHYGVPKDIIEQVDPTTLYLLVSTVEALVSSGITDPYEFYQYVHVSELSNTQGGGMGGMRAIRRAYTDELLERPVPTDNLQEMLINVMPAWINMLLLSSSGPIKTPVGACATAGQSIEMAVMDIQSGKSKIAFAGGYDDFSKEGSVGFAKMGATSNSAEEVSKGRDPREMSRPFTTTRAGFMEAQGAGAQILMSARTAIEMGVPIRAMVALTHTASDKQGRSVPAPGQGVMTSAKKKAGAAPSPLLDFNFRQRMLREQLAEVDRWAAARTSEGQWQADFITQQAERQRMAAVSLWNHDFWRGDPAIAPVEGALAVVGLTVDDIKVDFDHGTGTTKNDKNESKIANTQMGQLGRKRGNLLWTYGQKGETAHPKGAAAAWQTNGAIQVLDSGILPGNRNADNIDQELQENEYLVFPNRRVHTSGIKVARVKSFGFGQAGVEIYLVHPDYVVGSLRDDEFATYAGKLEPRRNRTSRRWQDGLIGRRPFVDIKEAPPYADDDEDRVLLDPTIRAVFEPKLGTWHIPRMDGKSNGTSNGKSNGKK